MNRKGFRDRTSLPFANPPLLLFKLTPADTAKTLLKPSKTFDIRNFEKTAPVDANGPVHANGD